MVGNPGFGELGMRLQRLCWPVVLLWLAAPLRAQEVVLPLVNGGFEKGMNGWTIPASEGISSLSAEQAASGKASLKVADNSATEGSDVTAARVAVKGLGIFELRGRYCPISGEGLGLYVRVLDAGGQVLNPDDSHLSGLGGTGGQWRDFAFTFYTPPEAAFLEVWIHSYAAATVTGYLDDLQLVDLGPGALKPPWQGEYKLKPTDTGKLTAADVVGPDGLVYPNWTRCGVEGGIPPVKAAGRLENYGGKADDDGDDSAALAAACEAVGKAGGGAVLLGPGTYYLDTPVAIRQDGVVIRGAGRDRTRLIFRYALPPGGVTFYGLPANARIGKATRLELHARPTGLVGLTISVDGTEIRRWGPPDGNSGNTFSLAGNGAEVIGKAADGSHALRGEAIYADGARLTTERPIIVDSTYRDERLVAPSDAAIGFIGQGYTGPRLKLAADGKRGATTLTLQSTQGLAVGDCILIEGPATERWKKLTRNACLWGDYRRYETRITRLAGNTITLEQPLRLEFPVIDGSYVQKAVPIQRCGIEDLYLEQTENLWISSVVFWHAWNCWARGVTVRKMGRFPVYGWEVKFCEIRDCIYDDAWYKGGGGTAYGGWESAFDCLIDGLETFKLRHAPLFQWAASGCVIRNGIFHESDGQWHSGWTNENLFENCVIQSGTGNGAYGYGLWASPPEDTDHGPNGPRNVVYNCDVSSPKAGLWMGGMNENWLILYNRFVVEAGPGVFAKTASFDHILRGNVFVLKDGRSPMLQLATPDCIGVDAIGNTLYGGNGKLWSGIEPAVLQGNRALALGDAPRPKPAVPSIYEWEKASTKR
jgi:hypothetical protein